MTKRTHTDKPEYEVGFKKPPKSTQFVKGQSGNPSGRPKGSRNWATIMHAAIEQKVTINENGRQRQVTKLEAATMQLANKAAGGDQNSIRLMLQLMPGMEAIINKTGATALSNEQDRKVLSEMLKRMQAPTSQVITVDKPLSDDQGAKDA